MLGDHLAPDMEVEIALRNHDIPIEFPDEVVEAVDRMPHEVKKEDTENRVDLREIPFVTIDGEDARDFDDAVYCEPKDSGGWRLYVAIADVASYVQHGTELDRGGLRTRYVCVLPSVCGADAAGKALERIVFAESERGATGCVLRNDH
ncbi:MAG: RNB domain-containing ribonuclease [Gammaproteobacteria bacterium]|nr:RNB domain-containing ribonuclease [Gammaproteobacteria bacterium]